MQTIPIARQSLPSSPSFHAFLIYLADSLMTKPVLVVTVIIATKSMCNFTDITTVLGVHGTTSHQSGCSKHV